MVDTDLAFEKSEVEAEVTTVVDSIKNPKSGTIKAAGVKEIIMDDSAAKGRIVITEESHCAWKQATKIDKAVFLLYARKQNINWHLLPPGNGRSVIFLSLGLGR